MSYNASFARGPQRVWRAWSPALLGASIPAGVILVVLQLEPSAKERQVCDALVQTLLTAHDAVELQRASIFVRELNCDVSRRVGPALYHQLVATPR